ncbi:hypothetical protein BSL78_03728 [Apostichopus japonicus]|uniref:L27 domain-containing protein n=1 Tax=Stichopus japonicus TaxID=307972 RepID=A0A2G8LGI5_STIJA|nr:hypothetical protein BSL78_03728 [Apostichopus japonicus]
MRAVLNIHDEVVNQEYQHRRSEQTFHRDNLNDFCNNVNTVEQDILSQSLVYLTSFFDHETCVRLQMWFGYTLNQLRTTILDFTDTRPLWISYDALFEIIGLTRNAGIMSEAEGAKILVTESEIQIGSFTINESNGGRTMHDGNAFLTYPNNIGLRAINFGIAVGQGVESHWLLYPYTD